MSLKGFPYGPLARPVTVTRNIESLVARHQESATEKIVQRDTPWNPVNVSGAFTELTLALSNPSYRFSGHAFGFVYYLEGSEPEGRLNFDFGGGGKLTNQPPGVLLPVRFDAMEITLGSRSVSTGNARLLIFLSESAMAAYAYQGPDISGGNVRGGAVGPSGAASQDQATTTNNAPVLATDGMSLVGINGFRVMVETSDPASLTLVSGTIQLWYYDTALAVWFRINRTYDVADGVGLGRFAWPEEDAPTGYGRIYAELVSGDESGAGSADMVVYVRGAA